MRDQNMTENIPIQLGLRVFIQIVTVPFTPEKYPQLFPLNTLYIRTAVVEQK